MQADTAMRLSEIRRLEQGQPFRPFRICLSDGSAHEVRDPNLLFLTQHTVIVSRREGRSRICRLNPEAMRAAEAWLAAHRRQWEARMDRFEAHLATQKKDTPHD